MASQVQDAIVLVTSNVGASHQTTSGLEELQARLKAGWMVKDVHPMTSSHQGGASQAGAFACLVIVSAP